MRKLLLFISLIIAFSAFSQNTSPVFVKDFSLQINGIMDIDQVPRDARTDFDSNPVCMIQVKAVGFDENLMQKFTFLGEGVSIMHKDIKNGMVILYVSSNKMGDIRIIHMGEYVYQLPYKLIGNKIYVMTLGMETATLVIRSVPTDADIYIDNEKVGTGYASKAVSIGAEHRYKVQCEYYWPVEDVVYFDKRDKKELNINLEPNFGFITIKTEPTGADVFIDDVKVGVTPYLMKKITLGTHVVELRKTGCDIYADMVVIKVGEVNKQFENVKLTAVQVPTGTLESASASLYFENRTFTVNGVSFEMVAVNGGTFTMGCTSEQGDDCSSSEKPSHIVTLSDYYIGKFEVTQKLWKAVMGSNPSTWKGDNMPVGNLSWEDVQEFIKKLNQKTGANFRLPTEAEWEYAARGGNKSKGYKYSGSNNINDVAWYTNTTNNSGTKPVGTKSPNELGIYDMTGNVWEWCQDWYSKYSSDSQTNPTGPSSGVNNILRGGSMGSVAGSCRVSYRNVGHGKNDNSGFRLALVP